MDEFDQSLMVAILVQAMLPVYLILQAWSGTTWTGRWRAVALAPLVVLIPLAIYGAIAFYNGANLWPLLLIFFAPIGGFYLLAATVVRWSMTRRTS